MAARYRTLKILFSSATRPFSQLTTTLRNSPNLSTWSYSFTPLSSYVSKTSTAPSRRIHVHSTLEEFYKGKGKGTKGYKPVRRHKGKHNCFKKKKPVKKGRPRTGRKKPMCEREKCICLPGNPGVSRALRKQLCPEKDNAPKTCETPRCGYKDGPGQLPYRRQ